jgi:Heterokaryon incompatibility protein (HET)
MRLIRTTDLTVHDFAGDNVPKYAILSHRWEEDEISLQELRKKRNMSKNGWKKVQSFCHFAERQGWEFVWIDTCCIDRTSSAELSEAINSMQVPQDELSIRANKSAGTRGIGTLKSALPTCPMSSRLIMTP